MLGPERRGWWLVAAQWEWGLLVVMLVQEGLLVVMLEGEVRSRALPTLTLTLPLPILLSLLSSDSE